MNTDGTANDRQQQQQSILHMLHFQYNYNASTVMTVRDRFCHAFFVKLSQYYARNVPSRARLSIEFALLALAILCSITLSYVHVAFVKSPIVCLDHVSHQWPHDGVLRVEVLRGQPVDNYTLEQSYLKELAIQHNLGMKHFKMSDIDQIMKEKPSPNTDYTFSLARVFTRALSGSEPSDNKEVNFSIPKDLLGLSNRSFLLSSEKGEFSPIEEMRSTLKEFERFRRGIWPSEEAIVEFSLDYGMLRLTPAARNRLNVPVHLVTLDADTDKCFGDEISRFVLRNFVGYNDILMGSLKRLAETEDNRGYVKNVITGEHFRFISMWTTRTSYLTAAIVMLVFTLTISMLMRYTHHQVFALIVDVLHFLEFNSGRTFRTAPLFTVILALVGMEAIMSEFFNDSSTAFAIIFIVWLADHFDALCCHTPVSKKHWPRFFFLYHFVFYAYDYRFNGQYSGLALLTSFLFILHSMVYFYHRYELPAIMRDENNAGIEETTALTDQNGNPTTQPSAPSSQRRQTPTSPDRTNGSSQQTQFVISARVTVTRRMETAPSSTSIGTVQQQQHETHLTNRLERPQVETSEESPVGQTIHSTTENSSTNSNQNRYQANVENANCTRKLSTSSAEASPSSCGCCSSNDLSDVE